MIVAALHVAGAGHLMDFDAMVKGRPAAVLEFTQWLKNASADPCFGISTCTYDACERRALCRQSIQGQNAWRVGGKRKSTCGRRGSYGRRDSGRAGRPSGGSAELVHVRGDCNSRCRTAFEDAAFSYTTGHGLLKQRTMRAREIVGTDSGGRGDANVVQTRRRFTGTLSTGHPENEGTFREDLTWGWPRDDPTRPRKEDDREYGQPIIFAHESIVVPDESDPHGRDERPQSKEVSAQAPPPLEWETSWGDELIVRHPRVPAGYVIQVEVKPVTDTQSKQETSFRGLVGGGEIGGHLFSPGGLERDHTKTQCLALRLFVTASECPVVDSHKVCDKSNEKQSSNTFLGPERSVKAQSRVQPTTLPAETAELKTSRHVRTCSIQEQDDDAATEGDVLRLPEIVVGASGSDIPARTKIARTFPDSVGRRVVSGSRKAGTAIEGQIQGKMRPNPPGRSKRKRRFGSDGRVSTLAQAGRSYRHSV